MMAAFNVTALTDLGYDEKTSFIDPMEPRYRNKFFSDSDLSSRSGDFSDSAIQNKVKFFTVLKPASASSSTTFVRERNPRYRSSRVCRSLLVIVHGI